jgi:hypothetical protein
MPKVERCKVAHPMYGRQVLCESPKGHDGDHWNSFFFRTWENNHDHAAIWSHAVAYGPCTR